MLIYEVLTGGAIPYQGMKNADVQQAVSRYTQPNATK